MALLSLESPRVEIVFVRPLTSGHERVRLQSRLDVELTTPSLDPLFPEKGLSVLYSAAQKQKRGSSQQHERSHTTNQHEVCSSLGELYC